MVIIRTLKHRRALGVPILYCVIWWFDFFSYSGWLFPLLLGYLIVGYLHVSFWWTYYSLIDMLIDCGYRFLSFSSSVGCTFLEILAKQLLSLHVRNCLFSSRPSHLFCREIYFFRDFKLQGWRFCFAYELTVARSIPVDMVDKSLVLLLSLSPVLSCDCRQTQEILMVFNSNACLVFRAYLFS